MTKRAHIPDRQDETGRYASREDFCRIFIEDLDELYQLSFLLTRDSQKAERCFVGGVEDCVAGNSVFHEWALSWARRATIQNAIRELKPRPSQRNPVSPTVSADINPLSSGPGQHFEIDAVLRLKDYERFVFVLSVLEHYSEHDCAQLLGCSVLEIREARSRALNELATSLHMDRSQDEFVVLGKK